MTYTLPTCTSPTRACVALLASLLVPTQTATAAPILTTSVQLRWATSNGTSSAGDLINDIDSGQTTRADSSGSYSGTNVSIFGESWANRTIGAIGAGAWGSASSFNVGPDSGSVEANVNAFGQWDDIVFSATGGSTASFIPVTARVSIDGTLLATGSRIGANVMNADGNARLDWSVFVLGLSARGSCWLGTSVPLSCEGADYDGVRGVIDVTVSGQVPVNVPGALNMGLGVSGRAFARTQYLPSWPVQGAGEAAFGARFENTMNLLATPFILPDGFTVNSQSMGIVDNRWIHAETPSVPEPTTLLLLSGATAMAFRQRIRRPRR